jgi:hypothetical protein
MRNEVAIARSITVLAVLGVIAALYFDHGRRLRQSPAPQQSCRRREQEREQNRQGQRQKDRLGMDNARSSRDQANERTQLAQVSVQVGHHHHHHHHHQVRISVLVPSATLNAVALKKATDTIPMGQAEKQVVASPINDSDASTLNQRVQGSSPCAPTISSTG